MHVLFPAPVLIQLLVDCFLGFLCFTHQITHSARDSSRERERGAHQPDLARTGHVHPQFVPPNQIKLKRKQMRYFFLHATGHYASHTRCGATSGLETLEVGISGEWKQRERKTELLLQNYKSLNVFSRLAIKTEKVSPELLCFLEINNKSGGLVRCEVITTDRERFWSSVKPAGVEAQIISWDKITCRREPVYLI